MAKSFKKTNISFENKDQTLTLTFWIIFLSVIIIIVATITNFNMGYDQFLIEMAEHWVDYKTSPQARALANTGPGLSATALQETYNKVAHSLNDVCVSITGVRMINGTPQHYHSSGIIVSQQHVLTNFHVVQNAMDVDVSVDPNATTEYPAKVILVDRSNDLALLKLTTPLHIPPARLGNSDQVNVGDMVFAMGNAFGSGNVFTTGTVSGKNQTFHVGARQYLNMFQTETYIYPGSSGGPLANKQGEIIGVNTAIYDPAGKFTGISFVTPIKHALTLLRNGQVPGFINTGQNMIPVAMHCNNPYSIVA